MTRKMSSLIFGCFILSVGVILFLFAVSKDIRMTPGSFLRNFPPHPAVEAETFNLGYNTYYMAGGTGHHLYLANYAAPLHMVVINLVSKDTLHEKLVVEGVEKQKFWAVRIKVDSPYYYVTDGSVPIIYKGNVSDWTAKRYFSQAFFQDVVPAGNESFFIRALGKPVRENILGKITGPGLDVKMTMNILEKQIDGIFCTDGMMHFNRQRNELLYLYRYRNEYIVMDTNLRVLQRHHTLDTITRVKIDVGTIKSSGSTSLASPPRAVNNHSCVYGNFLFVNSMLLAKNEHPQSFDRAAVIDVYDLSSGQYQFSFYIYNYKRKERLKQFSVFGDKLYALFEEHLQIWDLTADYFGELSLKAVQ